MPSIEEGNKRRHQRRIDALENLRDQLIALGHPDDVRIAECSSLEIVDHLEYGETARLIVWFAGVALYIDSLDQPGRYTIAKRSGTSLTTAGVRCDDVDDTGALAVYHRYRVQYGLPVPALIN
ncbi:hypothetical protein OHA25_61020 (plasmid) [Nonomuraea sp. NBC_00507]|uniref:hypothetical protein n=1 Tax=Nonomuraea sp. NBC_00507 TaxID=2976002 RepID=UPI002E170CFA